MLNTFRMGGIHPPQEKHSAQIPLSYAKVPEKLLIPINQHIGQPCEILVNKRDEVSRGMLLAKSTGFISSNVHAPLDGVVEKIMKFPQLSGKIDQCILLKPKQTGQDYARIIAGDLAAVIDPENIPAGEIRQRIAESGIVGMGGAGFPTHVKLTPPQEKRIDALIINGAECEPFITSNHRVMLEKSEEIIKGIRLLQRIFGQIPVYIGIEQNKPDASAKMRSSAQPELQFGTKAVETSVDGSPVHYYPALDADKKIAAVAVVVFAPNGFTNDFEIMVGIDSSLHVLDTYVLDHKETPGLGDGMKDEIFKSQFRGKGLDNFQWQVKKDGGDIDALTAATITSRAFTNGVERALKTAGQVWEKQK